jgi:glycosyltransferase involved in cell wall biosynthesis
MNPLISVITVSLRSERTIGKTIQSVLNQSYSNIEYIIVDGASTDTTVDIIRSYEKHFHDKKYIYKWISEPDKGIYDAFNKGLALATGEYIAFLNSDDWYEPDGIQNITEGLKTFPAIYCGSMNLYPADNTGQIRRFKCRPERLFQTMRIAHPATLVAVQIFDHIGKFSTDYKIAGDYDFFLRAKLNGFKIYGIDKIISNMLRGGASRDLMTVFKEERIIKNKNLGNKFRHWVWYFTNVLLYYLLIPVRKITNSKE